MAAATGLYIVLALLVVLNEPGLARDPTVIQPLVPALIIISALNIGVLVYIQTSKSAVIQQNGLRRAYTILAIGAILSETHSLYGLILTLLSGSMIYILGFSPVTWVSLLWVRARFKRTWQDLPDS